MSPTENTSDRSHKPRLTTSGVVTHLSLGVVSALMLYLLSFGVCLRMYNFTYQIGPVSPVTFLVTTSSGGSNASPAPKYILDLYRPLFYFYRPEFRVGGAPRTIEQQFRDAACLAVETYVRLWGGNVSFFAFS